MFSSKSALKAVKSFIDKSDFAAAAEKAAEIVKEDANNYTGLLFLGFAQDKLDQNEEAEAAYEKAAKLKASDPQALKGLITLYEKQGDKKLDQFHDVVFRLAEHYAEVDDKAQCQTVVDKYELFAKKHGSKAQYRHALELLLPSCSLYSYLEGRIPRPSHIYDRIVESAEAEEKEWTNTQIGERRTRLGARLDQVTEQVKLEALDRFQVEAKYHALIDWIEDDEARRGYEEKLLQRAYDNLLYLPMDLKPPQRDKVLNLANGMVIIKHPFELAWRIALEWVDAETMSEWDVGVFREFIQFFPADGLSKVLQGYLGSSISPFPKSSNPKDNQTEGADTETELSEADRLVLMVGGLEDSPKSILSHRIMAETYLFLEEFPSATAIARRAQTLHSEAIQKFGLEFQNSLDAVNILLANALISYQSPRYHPESRSIFDGILKRKQTATTPLLGVGLILEEDEDFEEAVHFLHRALQRDPGNLKIRSELAWCRALAKDLNLGLAELEALLSTLEAQRPVDVKMKSEVLYRIGYCKWHLNTSNVARKDKEGAYRYLIESIKLNPRYAPPYTLLGIYFEDYAKNRKRARVAFQKAFELSISELAAAARLAQVFADNAEWDLVELVAQRVVDSGKANPAPGSKKKRFSWPYAALGVVDINKQQYSKSAVSFQSALRISPADYHSWVGLGESYHHLGRHVSAIRALIKAESLEHHIPNEQTWFAKYMLANIQREMGAFDAAIEGYGNVLKIREGDLGVSMALLQTLAECAWSTTELGMFGDAAKLAGRAIDVALGIAQSRTDVFNLWKAVGDACSVLARARAYAANVNMAAIASLLQANLQATEFQTLQAVDKLEMASISLDSGNSCSRSPGSLCLEAAILAHKRGIYSATGDIHAQAVSWYNLGWAEYQAYISARTSTQSRARPMKRFLRAAMRCFKQAIELEARNEDFWNALGIATLTLSPKVSQHSLVRCLHLNEHSAQAWTNLGVLYLINNDCELANEAFTRAQSADPEYAQAWLGQGLLATLFGNEKEARGLFAHASEISTSTLLPSKRLYAMSAFDHMIEASAVTTDVTSLIQPLFALHQLHSQIPNDIPLTQLSGLYAERIGDHNETISSLERVCNAVEEEYESSESTDSLVKFAQTKAELARAYLAIREFEAATACAETALDLSSEGDLDPSHADWLQKLRLSARMTAGVAHSYLGAYDKSITMFQETGIDPKDAPDIVCMLAQVLWAKGGEVERSVAREQLYASVQNHPGKVGPVSLLGVIALLDNDKDAIEAIEEELQGLRLHDFVDLQDKVKVEKILATISASTSESNGDGAAIAEASRGVMIFPGQPQAWSELATATEDQFPAKMALLNALREVPPRGTLEADVLSRAYAQTGRRRDALQAVMVAPWQKTGYTALAGVL